MYFEIKQEQFAYSKYRGPWTVHLMKGVGFLNRCDSMGMDGITATAYAYRP